MTHKKTHDTIDVVKVIVGNNKPVQVRYTQIIECVEQGEDGEFPRAATLEGSWTWREHGVFLGKYGAVSTHHRR
jgi:hypothetical protein